MTATPKCPDCAEPMVEGFIPDASYGNSQFQAARWHPGAPQETSILGLKTGTRVRAHSLRPIRSWMCPRCGLLRSYVDPDPLADPAS